ncbi:MAG: hypothetical protein ACRDYA_04390 [Egibacteraceae bacterium]
MQLADRYFLSRSPERPYRAPEKIRGGVHAEIEQELGYELDRFIEELTFGNYYSNSACLPHSAPTPTARLLNEEGTPRS